MSFEYHQLLKYVYLEGYADSYEDAEYIIENLSDDEYNELYENVFRSRSSGAASADVADAAAEMHKTLADAPGMSKSDRKRHRDAAAKKKVTARRKRKEETNEEYIIDHLVSEGYTDDYDSALEIYEAMSEEWLYSILEVRGGGKVPFRGDTSKRGMSLNPSMKLYRKKIKLETDMEDEEDRIRRSHRADDGEHDDYTQSDDWRPERVSRGQRGRRASAKREIETSPKMKKLQSRWERLSDVERKTR